MKWVQENSESKRISIEISIQIKKMNFAIMVLRHIIYFFSCPQNHTWNRSMFLDQTELRIDKIMNPKSEIARVWVPVETHF